MRFTETPLIPTATLFRAAMVSSTRGRRVLDNLSEAGKISPLKTPTGRDLLTPHDGGIAFDALVTGS